MSVNDVARRLGRCFDDDGLAYAIGGALALGVWGAPRQTQDVDVSVFVGPDELPRVFDALERAGVMLDRTDAARRVERTAFFQGRLGRTIVDVFLSEHPQYEAMRQRSRRISDPTGAVLSFISAEDLCLHKLLFGRAKDVVDLERLLAVRPSLDLGYVRGWLMQMVPTGDHRIAVLDDLERRFANR